MKGLIAKHFIKIFSFCGNLTREYFNEKNFGDVEILQKTIFKRRISIQMAGMPIYFLAFNDERQGGVESNDKV